MSSNTHTPNGSGSQERPPLPAALQLLTTYPFWVCWRWVVVNDKPTKVPFQCNGRKASTDNPQTWTTYDRVMAAAANFDGIGFVLTNAPFGAFDLDHCRDPQTGSIEPWAQRLVEDCHTYTEITPSQTGLRIIGHAMGDKIHRKLAVPNANGMSCELFRKATRFITVTGHAYDDRPLANIDARLDAVLVELEPVRRSKSSNSKTAHQLPRHLAMMLYIPNQGAGKQHGEYQSRNAMLAAFINLTLKVEVSEKEIVTVCTDEKFKGNAIYEHCRENGGTKYVERQIERLRTTGTEYVPPPPKTLADVHAVCRKWFDDEYDLDAIDAVCAVCVAERLTGDPVWLLVISGSGAAKTETVQAVANAPYAHVTSTIASEGALLSASSRKQRAKNATGGLLRKIGERGILVIKDVTSILSADRHVRATVLAALREIHDGLWERNVGTDGGQTLTWRGRLIVIGAVTTAWDTHHAVVAIMGDRFISLRIDSNAGRVKSGLRAIRNIGQEKQMRQELADTVGGLVAHASTDEVELTKDETKRLIEAADLVTLVRTAVERDYKTDVIDAHMPEMPTRFAKQLAQVVRGGVAIGMIRKEAMRLALRCARDSMPPLRLNLLCDLASHPNSQVTDIRKRLDKPWNTLRRELEALHLLGLVSQDIEDDDSDSGDDDGGKPKRIWLYSLSSRVDLDVLLSMMATRDQTAEIPF